MILAAAAVQTTSHITYPAFIRPSVHLTTECNIWGPLCQTGSIVVAVNMTSTTTFTTVACSHYLAAQSASVASIVANPIGTMWGDDERMVDYQSSLGRSPECTSYAKALDLAAIVISAYNPGGNPYTLNPLASLPLPNCIANSSSNLLPLINYLPAGIGVGDSVFDFRLPICCGNCSFRATEFRLLYFPTDPISNCTSVADNDLMNSNVTSSLHWYQGPKYRKRTSKILGNFSSAVVISNSYTL